METKRLEKHTAELDTEHDTLALYGVGLRLALSGEEAYELFAWLYEQRHHLYAMAHRDDERGPQEETATEK